MLYQQRVPRKRRSSGVGWIVTGVVLLSLITGWLIINPNRINITLTAAGAGILLLAANPFYLLIGQVLLMPFDWLPAWGPLYLLGLLAFAGMAVALLKRVAARQPLMDKWHAILFLFVGLVTLSAFATSSTHMALRSVLPVWQAAALSYCFASFINTTARLRLVAFLIIGLGLLEAANCVVQPIIGPSAYIQRGLPTVENVPSAQYYFGPVPRAFGTFKHPAGAASFIGMAFFLWLAYLLLRNKPLKPWEAFGLALMAVGLVATFARAQLIAVALGTGWMLLRYSRQALHKALIVMALLIGILAVGFLLLPSDIQTVAVMRIGSLASPSRALASRSLVNRETLAVFLQHPLFGVGFMRLWRGLATYASELGMKTVGGEPHNLYLAIAGELGLTGLLMFLGLCYYSRRLFMSAIKRGRYLPFDLRAFIHALHLNYIMCLLAWLIGGHLWDMTVFLPLGLAVVAENLSARYAATSPSRPATGSPPVA